VVVARGRSVEIAFMPDLTGLTSSYATSLGNAVRTAVAAHPAVRGFPIRINVIDTPCGDSGADVAAAATVVANLQNVAVLGPFCSTADTAALPLFESADIVTLSGSTTNPTLPPLGQDVFNSVAVSDGCCPYADLFDPWYATVGTLPSDLAWRQAYEGQFGSPPTAFADLYYDAAGLLIRTIQSASRLDGNELVIKRAALARAVRSATKYQGVTCTVGFDPATGFRVNDPTALSRCAGP
jgi:ABC-type branched-subunit amino acid transport system substrate-binding protein